jgi:ABC-2 type transport system permease protein
MKIAAIAWVSVRRFIRDRANLFFVFVLPIGIIILIGAQFGGDRDPELGVYLPPDGGAIGQSIVDNLNATEGLRVVAISTPGEVTEAVALGRVMVGLVLPDRLTDRLAAGETLQAQMIHSEGGIVGPYEALLRDALAKATEAETIIRIAIAEGATRQAAIAAAGDAAEGVPEIEIVTTQAGTSLFEGVSGQFQIGATSQLILFMFLTGLTGSAALIQVRQFGVTRRMLATPTGASTVIFGEALGRYWVVLLQGLYIVLATSIMFGIDWGNLLGASAVILTFCAVGAAAAMLSGTLFANDQQAAGIGVVVGLTLAALGGCMVPLELFPPAMETIAYFTPHAWAMDAFADLQRRGASIIDILPQLGVILAFAIGLLALAAWRMRVTLGRI